MIAESPCLLGFLAMNLQFSFAYSLSGSRPPALFILPPEYGRNRGWHRVTAILSSWEKIIVAVLRAGAIIRAAATTRRLFNFSRLFSTESRCRIWAGSDSSHPPVFLSHQTAYLRGQVKSRIYSGAV